MSGIKWFDHVIASFSPAPDDREELETEQKASQERLSDAKKLMNEIQPMTDMLKAHYQRNHYGERLQTVYGRKPH